MSDAFLLPIVASVKLDIMKIQEPVLLVRTIVLCVSQQQTVLIADLASIPHRPLAVCHVPPAVWHAILQVTVLTVSMKST